MVTLNISHLKISSKTDNEVPILNMHFILETFFVSLLDISGNNNIMQNYKKNFHIIYGSKIVILILLKSIKNNPIGNSIHLIKYLLSSQISNLINAQKL